MTEQENQLDRKDLKILAYKEKVAQLEDANADLRVEVTILNNHIQGLVSRLPEDGDKDADGAEDVQAQDA